jgi:hypothetical protein
VAAGKKDSLIFSSSSHFEICVLDDHKELAAGGCAQKAA